MFCFKKKTFNGIFIFILILPLLLAIASKLFGIKTDVELNGYTENVQTVELSAASFWDESFQNYVDESLNAGIPLNGVMVKTCNTIQYHLFKTGNAAIGKSGFLFDGGWLNEASLGEYDFSKKELNDEIQNLVDTMAIVQRKLNAMGKQFFVYIAPNKVRYYADYLPLKYRFLYNKATNNSVEIFSEKLENAGIPFLCCWDTSDSPVYPEYYSGSFHWSRTLEQICSKNIIDSLNSISEGKTYRNIVLGEVKESDSPFWRDDDFFRLINVWGQPQQRYYEYTVTAQEGEDYDPLNILIQGDSYAQGLMKDILDNLSEDRIIYINCDEYIGYNSLGISEPFYGNYDSLDLEKYVSLSDIIVLELFEGNISEAYIRNYINSLNACLDSYSSASKADYYPARLDFSMGNKEDLLYFRGFYSLEDGFCWTKKQCSLSLNDSAVREKGLQIDMYVPEDVFEGEEIISIRVNDVMVYREGNLSGDVSVKISPENLPDPEDHIYRIDIDSSEDFCPKELGINEDERRLALKLKYVGEIK